MRFRREMIEQNEEEARIHGHSRNRQKVELVNKTPKLSFIDPASVQKGFEIICVNNTKILKESWIQRSRLQGSKDNIGR